MRTYTTSLVLCGSVLIALVLSSFVVRKQFQTSPINDLDAEMLRTVLDGNRWGYKVLEIGRPSLFDHGLTYWIEATVFFNNRTVSSVDEAEQLYVEVYRDFLHQMNSIRSIRPYLASFPLTPSTCRLSICFDDCAGQVMRPPFFASIIMNKDRLNFLKYIEAEHAAGSPCETVCSRSPRDVSGIKELFVPSVPRSAVDPKPNIPRLIQLPRRLQYPASNALFEYLQRWCLSSTLEITTVGPVGEGFFDIRPFEFALRGSQRLTLDEAKKFTGNFFQELLDFIRTDSRCVQYVKERGARANEHRLSQTPIPEQVGFRISFWDENIDRQSAPYIAEIRCFDGVFSYFTADENQSIMPVHEEKWDPTNASKVCSSTIFEQS